MKIFFSSAVLLLIISCDSIPDEIIDSSGTDFTIVNVTAPFSLVYAGAETALQVSVEVTNNEGIKKMWFNVISNDGTIEVENASSVEMKDNGDFTNYGDAAGGDNIFSGKVNLTDQIPSGDYTVEYYAQILSASSLKIAASKFSYDNAQNNIAPVLSDLIIPDEVERGISFVYSVNATDENGKNDIRIVYFQLTRPDGTQVIDERTNSSKFLMDDTGNLDVYGDEIAGDGRYSFKNSFHQSAQTGEWIFKFKAEDRGGKISNEIAHTLIVK